MIFICWRCSARGSRPRLRLRVYLAYSLFVMDVHSFFMQSTEECFSGRKRVCNCHNVPANQELPLVKLCVFDQIRLRANVRTVNFMLGLFPNGRETVIYDPALTSARPSPTSFSFRNNFNNLFVTNKLHFNRTKYVLSTCWKLATLKFDSYFFYGQNRYISPWMYYREYMACVSQG